MAVTINYQPAAMPGRKKKKIHNTVFDKQISPLQRSGVHFARINTVI